MIMDAGLAAVLVGLITAIGGIVVAVIQLRGLRVENKQDHAVVQGQLATILNSVFRVDSKVDTVTDRLDTHIQEHHEGISDGDFSGRSNG
jgi:hypothetical protein